MSLQQPKDSRHGQRRQVIVQSVLEDVFRGQLLAGQHLVTEEIATRFDVSHTPVREAFVALAGIGIVDLVPNRGAIVRPVTVRDVREICQVRRALECEATRAACGRIDLAELHDLATQLRRLQAETAKHGAYLDRARALDSRLHDLVANSCGNQFLAKELGRLKTLFRAFRDISYRCHEARHDYLRLAEEAGEHLAIVEALLARDTKEAVRAMSRHIKMGIKYWSRALPDADGSAPAAPPQRTRRSRR